MKTLGNLSNIRFYSLVWPILIEHFLRIVVMIISYRLVACISDAMGAILGVTSLYLLIGFNCIECLAQGNSIILSQYIGANKQTEVQQSYVLAIWFNMIFGIILTIVFFSCPYFLLSAFGFPNTLLHEGARYLKIVGSGFCIYTFNYTLVHILNSNGLTKYTMVYSLIVNGLSLGSYYLISITPNYLGYNQLTLVGFTNLFARCFSTLFLLIATNVFVVDFNIFKRIPWNKIKEYISSFFRIIIFNAFEPIVYQIFQFVLIKVISTMSLESLATRNYIVSLTVLFEVVSWSIAKGNQIIIGYFIGANKMEFVNKQLKNGIIASFCITLIVLYFGLMYRHYFMQFFSKDTQVIETGSELLIFAALVVLIRSFNFNIHSSLKAAGDVRFGFLLMMLGMWGVTLPCSYILVRVFHIGLKGIWMMFVVEELIRTFFFLRRWKSQKWKKYLLMKASF